MKVEHPVERVQVVLICDQCDLREKRVVDRTVVGDLGDWEHNWRQLKMPEESEPSYFCSEACLSAAFEALVVRVYRPWDRPVSVPERA